MEVSDRDKQFVTVVADFKQLDATQIHEIMAPHISREMLNRILRRLVRKGWLVRVARRVTDRAGSAAYVYTPSRAAWRELKRRRHNYRKPHPHLLETAAVYVTLHKAERAGVIYDLTYQTEVPINPQSGDSTDEGVRADLCLRFRETLTDKKHAYYVEVEVCEKDRKEVEAKIYRWLTAWKSATDLTVRFPYVLFVPTEYDDALQIEDVIVKLAPRDRELFKLVFPGRLVEVVSGP